MRYGVAMGSGMLMIKLPFTFYLAGLVPDIINVGDLSPRVLGALLFWEHLGRLMGEKTESGVVFLSGSLLEVAFSRNRDNILSCSYLGRAGVGVGLGEKEPAFVISDV